MLAIISTRINKNNFIHNHPKILYSLRKQPTCSLHTNKISLIHLRQSQGHKTDYKTLLKF
jgi:hypothetical protein